MTSVTVLSAPPALRAVGLLITNGVSVCDSRKLDTGLFSVIGEGARIRGRGRRDVGGVAVAAEDGARVVAVVLELAGEVQPAVVVVLDRLGVDGGPVVELHALAELERVGQAVGRELPGGGEARIELAGGAGLEPDEALHDALHHVGGVAVVDERRVGALDVAGDGDDEGAAFFRLACLRAAPRSRVRRLRRARRSPGAPRSRVRSSRWFRRRLRPRWPPSRSEPRFEHGTCVLLLQPGRTSEDRQAGGPAPRLRRLPLHDTHPTEVRQTRFACRSVAAWVPPRVRGAV